MEWLEACTNRSSLDEFKIQKALTALTKTSRNAKQTRASTDKGVHTQDMTRLYVYLDIKCHLVACPLDLVPPVCQLLSIAVAILNTLVIFTPVSYPRCLTPSLSEQTLSSENLR